jgi:hypothetical protein
MSDDDPELAGFDGNAAVIDGDVPMHVYEKAKEKRDRLKEELPADEVPSIEQLVSEVK